MAKKKSKKAATTGVKVYAYEIVMCGQYYDQSKVLKLYDDVRFILPEIVEYPLGRKNVVERVPSGIPGGAVKIVVKKTSVPITRKVNAEKCAGYVIKNFHLHSYLKSEYPDYKKFRTYEIVSMRRVVVDSSLAKNFVDTPIDEMDESQLMMFIVAHDVKCSLALYSTIRMKRDVVKMAYAKIVKKRKKESTQILTEEEAALARPESSLVETVDLDSEGQTIDTGFLDA